ncbi:MAG: pitrilysin family protein [Bryobacteraceae bacterium]|nr:pitrilysin family protein [Bryobacteraceae bacterium]
MRNLLALTVLLAPLCAGLQAQDLKAFEKRVTEFTLANGLHFIVLEKHDAPVVSFYTRVNAGSVDDQTGKTGIAHMFEHMAFKGTESIGSKNLALERKALANIERVYDQLEQARRQPKPDKAKIEELEKSLKDAIASADAHVESESFTRIMEDSGAAGLNASTGVDSTQYFVSFPANKLELWFRLEADRFRYPVFREFYKERDVVREEKRMRSESNPQGELIDAMLAASFQGHPYRTSPAGFASDIENYRVADAEAFRKKYYVPSNMVIAIAGDVDPKEVRALADRYFAPMPAAPVPAPVVTVEPKQNGERRVTIESQAQPMLLIGYKRPEATHKDDTVFDVLDGILAGGRTGMLYKELVEKRKIALAAATGSGFPGVKYPNLYIFFALPNAGKTVDEVEKAMYEIIEGVKAKPVDETTLKRVKTTVRAGLIRQLDSNAGMAQNMATFHAMFGDWRKLFESVEEIDKVTAADVQRVAKEYFVDKTKTVAYHVKPKAEAN